MDFITKLDRTNFLATYSLMQDIDSERNILPDSIIIPLIPINYKKELLPIDNEKTRKRHANKRMKLAEFLVKNGVLKSKKLVFRKSIKENELKLVLNDKKFDETLKFMRFYYSSHFKPDSENEDNKKSMQRVEYIKQEIINDFSKKEDNLNYKKLICLLNELNSNYKLNHVYSCLMLIRAVLDHIPPILGCNTFDEVVNNYSWQRTDKNYMKSLSKDVSDDALHRLISEKRDLLDMGNLPNNIALNRLLQECLEVNEKTRFKLISKINKHPVPKNIQIKLEKEELRWANFSIGGRVWSSFRLYLEIDNYKSNKPDYVSVSIKAKLYSGEEWIGNHFIFDKTGKQDEEFRIEKNEIKRVFVFISNRLAGNQTREPMPEISKDPLEIEVSTRSGEKFIIPLQRTQVSNR